MKKLKLDIQKFGVTSGTCYTNTTDSSRFRVDWWQDGDQDVVNNRTKINWKLYAELGHNYQSNAVRVNGVNINGQSVFGSYTWSNLSRGTHELASGTIIINHDADGRKTFNINLSGWTYSNNNYSGSQDFELNQILRYATITQANDFNDEQNPSFTYINPANTTMSCWLEINPVGEHLAERNISGSGGTYTWELTETERNELRAKIPNSNTATCRIGLYSTLGETTQASFKDVQFSIVNANPTFSNFEFADTNATTLALTGDSSINVNGYSTIQATISTANKATAIKSATMSKYRFVVGDKTTDITYSDSASVNGSVANAPNGTYQVYAIDSRNNATLVTKLASSEISYTPISFISSSCKVERNNGGVGDYAVLTLNGNIWNNSFGSVSNSIKSLTVEYKETSSSTWLTSPTSVSPTLSGNTFSFSGQVASQSTTFDLDKSYDFRITITDELSTTTTQLTPMASAVPNMSYADDGVGIMCDYDENLGGLLQVGGQVYRQNTTDYATLYSGNATYGPITLNDSIQNYDFILIGIQADTWSKNSMMIPVNDIVTGTGNTDTYEIAVFQSSSVYVSMQIKFADNTTLDINAIHNASWSSAYLKYVIGVKL